MIIKSFNLSNLNKMDCNLVLLYGENEGQKEEVIKNYFLNNFSGEVFNYDEDQILQSRDTFLKTALMNHCSKMKKIIKVNRVTTKLYDVIKELSEKEINNKKIIFNATILDKKSKIRKLFETGKDLICIPFYQDNNYSLFKIASDVFKKNNISISGENINLIIEKCSGDRRNLHNEINKILNYCLEKKKINREEISKLINFYEDENFFVLIDSCLEKNYIKVKKIINNNNFNNNDSIIIIRSLISRLKRLIDLKKLESQIGNVKETVNNFRPQIFWKDKEIVEKQIKIWQTNKIYNLLDQVNEIEVKHKKNSNLSNNLIFDLILNTSNS